MKADIVIGSETAPTYLALLCKRITRAAQNEGESIGKERTRSVTYIVQAGDCMASIAAEYGFFWEDLWNLPENLALKVLRVDPYVLFPGDEVYIPEVRVAEWPRPTDQMHKFVLKGSRERLKIVFTDENDKPITNAPYTLEVEDANRGNKLKFHGKTNGAGAIEQAIPPDAWKGHLVVGEAGDQREYWVSLGKIDPVTEISGAQGRLMNLGYYTGPLDGQMSAYTTTALLLFQEKYNLPPSGKNDEATQAKLKELFGS